MVAINQTKAVRVQQKARKVKRNSWTNIFQLITGYLVTDPTGSIVNTIWIYEICQSLKSGYIYFSCEIQTCLEFGLYAALLKICTSVEYSCIL